MDWSSHIRNLHFIHFTPLSTKYFWKGFLVSVLVFMEMHGNGCNVMLQQFKQSEIAEDADQ